MPAIGDKFSSRCGQKGTLGVVIPEEDMPYTASGIRPDIIINPHAIPSRMTIGQLVETIMGKACSMYGAFGDCTAFVNNGSKHKIFGQLLTNQGMHSSGGEILYNGQTGEQLETEIFMGPTYYMRLKHMVKDKINYRALGPRTALTRQPVQGRANDGGLRIGEMERDGLIAHGVTKFLQESMLIRGDEYFMAVCNKTGTIAIYNNSYNLFLSPFADGPIKFSGTLTDGMNVQNISRYGRTFSIVRIPYAFKLLIQELQTMNVQLRLITEDNIDQLTSLSFSDNINKINAKFISGERKYL
jgi:DNA-directed RNA polymerase II subunit RPB2